MDKSIADSRSLLSNRRSKKRKLQLSTSSPAHIDLPKGVCSLCQSSNHSTDDPLLKCVACNVQIHAHCYGATDSLRLESQAYWKCAPCQAAIPHPPKCAICMYVGGALKATTGDSWCHLLCALWIPEIIFADETALDGIELKFLNPQRKSLLCSLCKTRGFCIQCDKGKCAVSYHPWCAALDSKQRVFMGITRSVDDSGDGSVKYSSFCAGHSKAMRATGELNSYSPFLYAGQRNKRAWSIVDKDLGGNDGSRTDNAAGDDEIRRISQNQPTTSRHDLYFSSLSKSAEWADTASVVFGRWPGKQIGVGMDSSHFWSAIGDAFFSNIIPPSAPNMSFKQLWDVGDTISCGNIWFPRQGHSVYVDRPVLPCNDEIIVCFHSRDKDNAYAAFVASPEENRDGSNLIVENASVVNFLCLQSWNAFDKHNGLVNQSLADTKAEQNSNLVENELTSCLLQLDLIVPQWMPKLRHLETVFANHQNDHQCELKRDYEDVDQYTSWTHWKHVARALERGVRDKTSAGQNIGANLKPSELNHDLSKTSKSNITEASHLFDEDPFEDGICCVCFDGQSEELNQIVFCDRCDMGVHQFCYGLNQIPEGEFYCDACAFQLGQRGNQSSTKGLSCALCTSSHGGFKATTDGDWAHLMCAIWCPGVEILHLSEMGPVRLPEMSILRSGESEASQIDSTHDRDARVGFDCPTLMATIDCEASVSSSRTITNTSIHEETSSNLDLPQPLKRWDCCCSVCHIEHGLTVKCSYPSCQVAIHPICAWFQGFLMAVTIPHSGLVYMGGGRGLHFQVYCRTHSTREWWPTQRDIAVDESGRRLIEVQKQIRNRYRISTTSTSPRHKHLGDGHKNVYSSQKNGKGNRGVQMQDLPPDVYEISKCAVCFSGRCLLPDVLSDTITTATKKSRDVHQLYVCTSCHVPVHRRCYGITDQYDIEAPMSRYNPFLCDVCRTQHSSDGTISKYWNCEVLDVAMSSHSSRTHPIPKISCMLCPRTGGAFKATTEVVRQSWVHNYCANNIPGVLVPKNGQGPIDVHRVSRERHACCLCNRKKGVCVQCSHPSCKLLFHPLCGKLGKCHQLTTSQSHYSETCAETASKDFKTQYFCSLHSAPGWVYMADTGTWENPQEQIGTTTILRATLDRARLLLDMVRVREKKRRQLIVQEEALFRVSIQQFSRQLDSKLISCLVHELGGSSATLTSAEQAHENDFEGKSSLFEVAFTIVEQGNESNDPESTGVKSGLRSRSTRIELAILGKKWEEMRPFQYQERASAYLSLPRLLRKKNADVPKAKLRDTGVTEEGHETQAEIPGQIMSSWRKHKQQEKSWSCLDFNSLLRRLSPLQVVAKDVDARRRWCWQRSKLPSFVDLNRRISYILNSVRTKTSHSTSGDVYFLIEAFEELPDARVYPSYYTTVARPIDFTCIYERAQSFCYESVSKLDEDFSLMVTNAKAFNAPSSQVYKDADVIRKVFARAVREAGEAKAVSRDFSNSRVKRRNTLIHKSDDKTRLAAEANLANIAAQDLVQKTKNISIDCKTLSSLQHPYKLIGRQISVYWAGDDAWYTGLVCAFEAVHNEHQIMYDDGEWEFLSLSSCLWMIMNSSTDRSISNTRNCTGSQADVFSPVDAPSTSTISCSLSREEGGSQMHTSSQSSSRNQHSGMSDGTGGDSQLQYPHEIEERRVKDSSSMSGETKGGVVSRPVVEKGQIVSLDVTPSHKSDNGDGDGSDPLIFYADPECPRPAVQATAKRRPCFHKSTGSGLEFITHLNPKSPTLGAKKLGEKRKRKGEEKSYADDVSTLEPNWRQKSLPSTTLNRNESKFESITTQNQSINTQNLTPRAASTAFEARYPVRQRSGGKLV